MLTPKFSAYSAVESKAFRLRSSAVHSSGGIGWALFTPFSHGEVERHAGSGAVFPPLTPIWSVVFLYV